MHQNRAQRQQTMPSHPIADVGGAVAFPPLTAADKGGGDSYDLIGGDVRLLVPLGITQHGVAQAVAMGGQRLVSTPTGTGHAVVPLYNAMEHILAIKFGIFAFLADNS